MIMKKPLTFICVLLVLLTLCSCGKKQIIEVEVNTDPSEVKTGETDKTVETTQDGKDANITGIWQDSVSKKTILNAVKSDDVNGYSIYITRSNDESSSDEWILEAVFSEEKGGYEYKNCINKTISYDAGGNETDEKVVYENGTGLFVVKNGFILWFEGDSEEIKCRFEPVSDYSDNHINGDLLGGNDDIVGVWED